LEAELKNKFDVDVKLIPSSGGVFEVTVDDKLVTASDPEAAPQAVARLVSVLDS